MMKINLTILLLEKDGGESLLLFFLWRFCCSPDTPSSSCFCGSLCLECLPPKLVLILNCEAPSCVKGPLTAWAVGMWFTLGSLGCVSHLIGAPKGQSLFSRCHNLYRAWHTGDAQMWLLSKWMNEGSMFDAGALTFRSTCFSWHLRHPPWGLQWHGQFHCRILLSQKVPAVWTGICKEDGGGEEKREGKIKPDGEKDFLVRNSIHSQLFNWP